MSIALRIGSRSVRERGGALLPYLIVPVFLIAVTLVKGVPAMRHDWAWPRHHAAFFSATLDWTSGWDVSGLGHPRNVTMYLLAAPALAVGAVAGSATALGGFLALIGVAFASAVNRLRRRFALSPLSTFAVACLIVANPWVYCELVAGHLGMLLAYGCIITLWSELLGARFDRRSGILALAGATFQPQLFVLAWLACASRSRDADVRAASTCGAIFFLPYLAGAVAHLPSLAQTPLTVTWERAQSVPPAAAILLRGYFTDYAHGFGGTLPTLALTVFGLLAVIAFVFLGRDSALVAGLVTAGCLIAATGTRGPLGGLFDAGFERVPALGFFRELYDLIGFVAAGYAIGAATTLGRLPALRWAAVTAGMVLVGVWFVTPPAAFWVRSDAIAIPAGLSSQSYGRYALTPPFQPLSSHDGGSGIDPATLYETLLSTPLNTYENEFPETSALGSLWVKGDARAVKRLGVSRVFCRTALHESDETASATRPRFGPLAARGCSNAGTAIVRSNPIVSLQDGAAICTLCDAVGEGNVFDGDADADVRAALEVRRRAGAYEALVPGRLDDDAASGWIDARLAFRKDPDIAQAFGGVYTTSRAPLAWHSAPFALANVRGRLLDRSGVSLAKDTRGFAWVRLPATTRSIRCDGACAVALQGDPGHFSLRGVRAPSAPLAWTPFTPWLLSALLPPGDARIVRYLESYDFWWVALVDGKPARHIRLDAAINGWLVPARDQPARVLIFHAASLIQFGFELLAGALFVGVLLFPLTRDPSPAAPPRTRDPRPPPRI